ncbi:Thioredoxin-like protein [Glarea lozoyensis ATCC 20868]|uniref:Thioredoxin-like protein n=1 Tax=Glarea lozoyensis (strain ATCC 20868 / MF5171) TaxID=1116229 RepID=S3DE98_GLAL2|nr:Thioredoxin-like protein [Glarea lozoyensis ATCC 20868]EPE36085.1 Thioredoxin-like protein [Glarea lozoyensis ATCC 20868]
MLMMVCLVHVHRLLPRDPPVNSVVPIQISQSSESGDDEPFQVVNEVTRRNNPKQTVHTLFHPSNSTRTTAYPVANCIRLPLDYIKEPPGERIEARTVQFAQELLSTFSDLGEVALQPSTGGTFVVNLYHAYPTGDDEAAPLQKHLLWDRKAEGGFPETKELKRRVRDVIDPARNLGHVDGHKKKPSPSAIQTTQPDATQPPAQISLPAAPGFSTINISATSEPSTPLPLPSPISPLETHHRAKNTHIPTLSSQSSTSSTAPAPSPRNNINQNNAHPQTSTMGILPVTASMGELVIGGPSVEKEQSERKFTPMDIDGSTAMTSTTTGTGSADRRKSFKDGEAIGNTHEEECEDCKDLD